MDEFHYYSDRERGVAWQVPLLTLPKARFMLMSATLGDVARFETGLTALNGRPTTVIKSRDRPVPLTFVYQETPLHETVQNLVATGKAPVYLVAFTQREATEEAQNLMSVEICTKDEKQKIAAAVHEFGIRFSSPFGKDILKYVKHGVGVHHAGLLPKYRLLVERLAQKGMLKVICGTDTLGVGVNIPIRTVLFTKMCKYDGEKTGLLTVRDFQQIAGRAGRKGFDDQGLVVAQAPEHVIDNLRLEAKAGGDPKKLRKIVKRKPPEKGFVLWTKETFEKLRTSEPEPLASRFQVTHGMLLQVLAREGDGCGAMRQLIRDSHETPVTKERLRKLAFQMFRSLLDRKIIDIQPAEEGSAAARAGRRHAIRVNVDLQEDFSIHHALALWLLDTVKLCDANLETYALDIVTCAEAIVEDPELILRKQLDRLKGERIAAMKAEGIEYEERMAELEKMEHPKPNREFIYSTFNDFAALHPWIGQDNIRPKSIAREMYESWMTFPEYVREYGLERSEGLLLRYLSEIYKVLVQTVPASAKDEEMSAIIDYLGAMVRQVDSTLLDEWEKLRTPGWRPTVEDVEGKAKPDDYDVTRNKREFTVAVRNEAFQYVKALANGRVDVVAEIQKELATDSPWTTEGLRAKLTEYKESHAGGPLTDRRARTKDKFTLEPIEGGGGDLALDQVLGDNDGHDDWRLGFRVDIAASRTAGKPVLKLTAFGPIGAS
jgi:superfamily II RNA helicase